MDFSTCGLVVMNVKVKVRQTALWSHDSEGDGNSNRDSDVTVLVQGDNGFLVSPQLGGRYYDDNYNMLKFICCCLLLLFLDTCIAHVQAGLSYRCLVCLPYNKILK